MTDISPKDLWTQIVSTPRPSRVVDFPRNDKDGKPLGEVRIRVLTQEEQTLGAAEAERFTRKAIKEIPKTDDAQLGYTNVYMNAAAVEVLYAACRKVDDPEKPFFPSKDALRQYLTADECGVLMVHYYTAQADLGPIVSRLTEAEADAWVERLGEGGSAFPLGLLSWEALKDLAFTLACRIHKSQTASTSPGSQPESDSKNSNDPSQLPLL